MSQLVASQLAKSYRRRQVVREASLDVSSGVIVGLLGPNVRSKTTCCNMIVGLVTHDGVYIELLGKDITDLPMHLQARRGIGYLTQEASIIRKLTVAKNIMAVLELRKEVSTGQREDELNKPL